jgi:hypothetical protein
LSNFPERGLKFLGRQTNLVDGTVIDFYIEPANTPGPRESSKIRHLIARYEKGGRSDLPFVDGKRESATAIPDDWSQEQVMQVLIDWDPLAPDTSSEVQ